MMSLCVVSVMLCPCAHRMLPQHLTILVTIGWGSRKAHVSNVGNTHPIDHQKPVLGTTCLFTGYNARGHTPWNRFGVGVCQHASHKKPSPLDSKRTLPNAFMSAQTPEALIVYLGRSLCAVIAARLEDPSAHSSRSSRPSAGAGA